MILSCLPQFCLYFCHLPCHSNYSPPCSCPASPPITEPPLPGLHYQPHTFTCSPQHITQPLTAFHCQIIISPVCDLPVYLSHALLLTLLMFSGSTTPASAPDGSFQLSAFTVTTLALLLGSLSLVSPLNGTSSHLTSWFSTPACLLDLRTQLNPTVLVKTIEHLCSTLFLLMTLSQCYGLNLPNKTNGNVTPPHRNLRPDIFEYGYSDQF